MKPASQDKTKIKCAIGLLATAIALAIYNFVPGRAVAPLPAHAQGITTKAEASKEIRDFALQTDFFERRQFASFDTTRNIFTMKEERSIVPGPGPQDITPHHEEKSSIAETLPPIDLKFFGYFRRSGEPKKIFVSQGDLVFLAQEGNLVGLRYKILEIKNDSVVVQDVFNNRQQSLYLLQ